MVCHISLGELGVSWPVSQNMNYHASSLSRYSNHDLHFPFTVIRRSHSVLTVFLSISMTFQLEISTLSKCSLFSMPQSQ
uniref:Uncharacterized protein n=1 Tax=Picea glauca TaxID=3330 RepID=A0A101LWH4_PICGL|nr:hypothetical protein ABT39_MTgene1327 [Picea glauca]QHR89518.1 hypothetical protein Q903MT_gene3540 [Picea sitchensis]